MKKSKKMNSIKFNKNKNEFSEFKNSKIIGSNKSLLSMLVTIDNGKVQN
jgi:hypothetical protein